MNSTVSLPQSTRWLAENGPKELGLLFRAVAFQRSPPLSLAENDLNYREEKRFGRSADAVLQVRPLFVLRGKSAKTPGVGLKRRGKELSKGSVTAGARDCALFLLDIDGQFAVWHAAIYGYGSDEVIGRHLSLLCRGQDPLGNLNKVLKSAVDAGHACSEGWHVKKNGARFWATVVIMALKAENGDLQGFAGVVRDFSGRHEREGTLRRGIGHFPPLPKGAAIAGVVSGKLDSLPEANDTFLDLVGYNREDLQSGRLHWPDLTPPEYLALDEIAHEEGIRFGACTPFEKELIRKDGTRVPVLVTTAVLKLAPFQWITFVQDLRERGRLDVVGEADEINSGFEEIVGRGMAIMRVLGQVEVVAPTDATVLVMGETGTGKELVAHAIHRLSPRIHFPFITLNCAAIPTGLLESELFGYERGAFTGALSQKIGRFELAHRGTLFLDEVGDIPLELQPKLLRALQEKSFERLGGTKTIPIDVRLVAATNRNLTQMMGDKLFRSDLYYRLKVFPITVPPLRERPEDIPKLVRHFIGKFAAEMGRTIENIPMNAMRAFLSWPWPGNVRELENFIERSVILSPGPSLRAPLAELHAEAVEITGNSTLDELERHHILRVFRETGGSVSAAATRLGLPRTTLNAMMKKLGISRKDL